MGITVDAGREFGRLAQSVSWTFVAHVAGAALGFGAQVAYARILGPAEFGEFVFVVAWITVVCLLTKGGLDGAVSRFAREAQAQQKPDLVASYIRYSLATGLKLALGMAAIIFAVISLGRLVEDWSIWLIAMLTVPLVTLVGIQTGALRGIGMPVWSVLPQYCARPVASAILLLVWYLFAGRSQADAALTCFAGGFVVALFLSNQVLAQQVGWFRAGPLSLEDRARVRDLGIALIGAAGAILIMRQADVIMLGMLVGTTDAGLYSAALRIVDVAAFPLIAANTVIGPLVSEAFTKGELVSLQRKIAITFRALSIVMIAVCAVIYFAGHWLLAIYGDAFVAATSVLGILLLGQILNTVSGPGIEVLSNSGHHRVVMYTLWTFAILNVLLNFILIPLLGLAGAAIATSLSLAAWNISLAFIALRRTGIRTFVLMPLSLGTS